VWHLSLFWKGGEKGGEKNSWHLRHFDKFSGFVAFESLKYVFVAFQSFITIWVTFQTFAVDKYAKQILRKYGDKHRLK